MTQGRKDTGEAGKAGLRRAFPTIHSVNPPGCLTALWSPWTAHMGPRTPSALAQGVHAPLKPTVTALRQVGLIK